MYLFVYRNDVGVFISDIVKDGVAEADGRLARGDQILAINGEDVRDARQDKVASLLKVSNVMYLYIISMNIFNLKMSFTLSFLP